MCGEKKHQFFLPCGIAGRAWNRDLYNLLHNMPLALAFMIAICHAALPALVHAGLELESILVVTLV